MYLVIDLGGTYVKRAYFNEAFEMIETKKLSTPSRKEELLSAIKQWSSVKNVKGIAISSPGTVYPDGQIGGTSAIPYLHHGNMTEEIQRITGLKTSIENDANCAALAELWKGEAQLCQDAAVLVIGTGVGGALLKDGTLHRGFDLLGGEIGYSLLSIDPFERRVESWSILASTSAIVRHYCAWTGKEANTLTGESVFAAAEEGDSLADKAINAFYFCLAAGIYNIHYLYNPERILIGGGISERSGLLERVNKELDAIIAQLPDLSIVKPRVRICHFKQHANLVGALYHFIKQAV